MPDESFNPYKEKLASAEGDKLLLYKRVFASLWLTFLRQVNKGSIAPSAAHDWLLEKYAAAISNPENITIDLSYGDREFDLMDADRQALTSYLRGGQLTPGQHHLDDSTLPNLRKYAPFYNTVATHQETV